MHQDIIKVITGIRRCGKSMLLSLIRDELLQQGVPQSHLLMVNFESFQLEFEKTLKAVYAAVQALVKQAAGSKVYLLFDEIQELEHWERVINACQIDFNCDIYLTGSNAYLLSSELSTYLSGRYIEIPVYPFSFREVWEYWVHKGTTSTKEQAFEQYLILGGMPFIHQNVLSQENARVYLEDVFESVLVKDIVARNKVRDIETLRRILVYCVANSGRTFSASSIVKYLKNEHLSVSLDTLYRYIEYFKASCLVLPVNRFDIKGKEVLRFQQKLYLCDHGFRHVVFSSNMRDIEFVLENLVLLHLLQYGYKVFVGQLDGREIDFVAQKGERLLYVQVCYLLAGEESREREFGNLEKIRDNFPKYVVSMDPIRQSRNGIEHYHIIDFLLSEAL
ncbi:MAG: ATP-binding protein [Sphaerochaeta sp.]|uniref:ATP-binding protein n=1 Tax=Sphaerochaeta sp. TaxID=1972642 RepID=UPI002A36A0F6|nr:ATP-binding protein [Sphaerochaeta sp.]MDX9824712.1 ATP-binding protein [Sphaerochaeta sp.]